MRTLAALLALPLLSFSDEQEKPAKSFAPDPTARIVVHEWGVVTCAAGARNQLVGASGPADEDLPAFVTRLTTLGQSYAMVARQPIIYFYTDKPTDFSVQVRFPNGYPTCFDPPAQTWANTADYKTPGAGNIGWQGRLDPAAAPAFPEVAPDHWVAHCRSVDSTPVTIGSRREKYLFYEGAVSIACPVRLELDGDSVRAEFAGTWTAPSMAVRVKDGRAETYPVAGAGRLAPEPVAVESMLAKAGLYEK
ncbi:MAG: hypothetical protein HYY17_16380, partial [Planctomycetes bacterium]|nr:hypothetical protein [Planctomycetota bacterium]